MLGGLPWWLSGKEPAWQCRRHWRLGFDFWVRKIPWRRKWHPTPVFLPGKSHGQRRLVGNSLWGCKELDTTEWLSMHAHTNCWTLSDFWTISFRFVLCSLAFVLHLFLFCPHSRWTLMCLWHWNLLVLFVFYCSWTYKYGKYSICP